MHVHRDFFLSNPRLGMLIRTWDKTDPIKRNQTLDIANRYLSALT
jgi:deoxyribodipyrimidine photolyase-related protein